MKRPITSSALAILVVTLLPATAFACLNKMIYTWAAATFDFLIFAPFVASGIIVVMRNRDRSTMAREVATVVASFVGALGVGIVFGAELYRGPHFLVATAISSVPLALTLIEHDGPKWAQTGRRYLLAATFIIAGVSVLLFGLTSHDVKMDAGFHAADPSIAGEVVF